MLGIIEDNLIGSGSRRALAKRAGHVLVEILQNVSKHARVNDGTKEGIFMIGFRNERIFVQVGNEMPHNGIQNLESWLNTLAGLEKEALREIHKTRIRASVGHKDKFSSGLGLIEIAQAISEPWQFRFDKIDNSKAFFSLHLNV
jgi:hypothetical protein